MPTSDINFDLGNFMVHVELLTQNGTSLVKSSRPAILRYQSTTQRILHVFAKALPLLFGWTEESQEINVVLIENYIDKKVFLKYIFIIHFFLTLNRQILLHKPVLPYLRQNYKSTMLILVQLLISVD